MPQTMRSSSTLGSNVYGGNRNYYRDYGSAYSTEEKYEMINEILNNLMDKNYYRSSYSVRKMYSSWQMSK